ncbi:FlgD immunoglobulin-like domain containing protein [Candidatus Poribacteria bacterium]
MTWSTPLPYVTSRDWDFTVLGGNDNEGIKTVFAKFRDAAGNWMQDPVSDDIELDKTGPVGTLLINNGAAVTDTSLVNLSLTAVDKNGVAFMRLTNGNDKWSPPEPFNNTRRNWDFTAEEYGGDNQRGVKTVYVRFIDSVGNESAQAASDDIQFRTEVTASVQIFAPEVEGKIKNDDIVTVEGSSDLGLVQVTMDVLDDIGRSLDINLSGVTYNSETGQITGSFPIGELTAKSIQFEVSVEDILGNRANATSNILEVDNDPPRNGAVSIDQGQMTNSTSVGLSIFATDVLEMYVEGDIVGRSEWIAYADTLSITLTEGDGTKTVTLRFRDDMGNEAAEVSDQVVLDTVPPTGSVVINNGDEYTGGFVVALTLLATDENGVAGYQLSNDGSTWSDESQMLTGDLQIDQWDLRDYGGNSDEGSKTVYVRYKDKAGNWGEISSDDVLVDTTAPTVSVQVVKDKQEAMEPVAITAIIKSDRPIIEANLHYRIAGPREYTTLLMTHLPGNYFTAEIPGSDVTLNGVEYYVSAFDGRFTATHPPRNAPISPNSFTVVDTVRPAIEHDQVKESPVNSSPEIVAIATDAVGVKQVSLFYKVLPDRNFIKVNMIMTGTPNEYSATIPGLDQLGTVAYYVEAVDFSGNSRTVPSKGNTLPYNISFVDAEPPVLSHTEIIDGQEAGESVVLGATVVDNVAVDSVVLKYKVPDRAEDIEVEMTNVGSFYSAEIPGELVMPGIVEYSITASDGSPQSADTTVSHSFTVVDTTPPTIELTFAPSEIEVHNEMSIQAEVTDNVAVVTVTLFYKGTQDITFRSISMNGRGKKYSATIPQQGWPGEVKFYVYAEDSHGVPATDPAADPQNAPRVITVLDITNPVIEHSPLLGVHEAGVPVTISATITDDVEVSDVSLHYRAAGNQVFKLGSMARSGSSLYSGSIPASAVVVPGLEYYIKAVDEASNVVTHPAFNPDTRPHSFSVVDTKPPEISYNAAGLATVLITEPIIVTVEATDLTGIKEVQIIYRAEHESALNFLAADDVGGNRFSAQIPSPLAEGRIYYYIQAEDNSGNISTSPVENPAEQPYSTFVDDPFPPLPPTRLAANGSSGGRILLTWDHSASSDVDGYNIYTDNGSGTVDYSGVFVFVPLSSLPADSAAWESPALGEGLYKFAVRAIDKSGNEEGNTTVASARADATKPDPATNLVAESRPEGRIQLQWTLSISKDAAAYNIYSDDAQLEIDYSKPLVRMSDPNVSWTSDKLRDGVVYRFVVRCQDEAGNEEENTNFVSARADATPPGIPTGLSSSTHNVNVWSNQPQVTVRWTPASDGNGTGLEGYSLLWNSLSGTMPLMVMNTGNVTTETEVLSGTQYFHLRAVDKAGNWSVGAAHLGPFLIDTQSPQAPTNLRASPLANGKIGLDWGASASSDVVRYNIYWDDGSGRGVDYSNNIASVTGLTWTSPELADGTTSEFAVRAEDRAGNEEKNTRSVSGIADGQPPDIAHKPIAGLLEQEIADVFIEATVTDASGLASVKLNYRQRGVTNYEETGMTKGANNRYRSEIPATSFSSAGVDYFISASDEAGNVARGTVFTIAVGTVLEMEINPSSENEILLGDGSSIHFPAGAVTSHRELTIAVPKFVPEPQKGLGKHIVTREFSIDEDLSKSINFTLLYDNRKVAGEDETKLAVYLWNGKMWDFVTDLDEQDNLATVTTMRLGIFSIMGDYEPPEVSDLQPSGYAEPEIKITAQIKDTGSGIDPQEVRILMNGQSIEVPGTALKDEELILPLPQPVQAGVYSMQLTVRDNMGNQTVATSEFQVEGKLVLKEVYCYPNPFQPSMGAHFAYTLTESVDEVTLRIFSMDGKLVREIEGTTSVGENDREWDGRDEQGDSVLSSVYICHIEAKGSEDTVTETIKIAGWE